MKLFSRLLTDEYFARLASVLDAAENKKQLHSSIVNAPFHDKSSSVALGLGIIVLLLHDDKTGTINRIALSNTEEAKGAQDVSVKQFQEIRIPSDDANNIIAQVIRSGEPKLTSDWNDIFTPELSPEEARFNQAGAGIGCSLVCPLKEIKGALIFSYFIHPSELTKKHVLFMKNYTRLASKAILDQTTSAG